MTFYLAFILQEYVIKHPKDLKNPNLRCFCVFSYYRQLPQTKVNGSKDGTGHVSLIQCWTGVINLCTNPDFHNLMPYINL